MSYVHYTHVASSLPRNFIAIGDAVMRLNPLGGLVDIHVLPRL
jgi:hypothetical protein